MNKQLGVRMFSTIGARSYKAYKAPGFWRASSHYMRAGNKNWHRYYHDRNSFGSWSYGPWAWKGYHHHHHHGHRRGGFFGYLFVGLIGFWFGYHTDSKDWRRHHQERLERFNKNKEEWNKEWNNADWGFGRKRHEQPQLEQPQDDNSMKSLPDQSSSDHGTNYGLWKS